MNKQRRQLRHLFVILILCTSQSACVSIGPRSSGIERSQIARVKPPGSPYSEVDRGAADAVWRSSKTSSSISYFTTCSRETDDTVEALKQNSLRALSEVQILLEERIQINKRGGLQVIASGYLDGVPVKTQLVIFKKDWCNYTLSYVGVLHNFGAEVEVFQAFVDRFEVP
ncbi:MAG: hypothetical protein COT74_09235 [Bdellovibrionales bacterium CG10_big_fil_rev_8_21_14_0_10_45_34]|nr:MAG: hypothetical protein COT74_09235 [Bdellovibrionales bacterium CG10_big_fil_rev_8_21_14_0_10_45_34]